MHLCRKDIHLFLLLLSLVALCSSCVSKRGVPTGQLEAVKDVDLSRYAGKWYEIARLPHFFEKGLVGVTATYTLRPDGKVEVLNRGLKGSLSGEPKEIRGTAVVPDPKEPGKLKVYFFPLIGGDYWILDLDRDGYQYALVGSPPKYLWILSRAPQMDPEIFDRLVEKARRAGFAVETLIKVPQGT